MKKGNRSLALAFAAVLIVGSIVGSSLAWLIAAPEPIVNTFTYGDINITLTESASDIDDGDQNSSTNKYKMLPGQTIEKDPKVTVRQGSEDMWLFVKLEKSENFDDFMSFLVNSDWVALEGYEGVYFRNISAAEVKDSGIGCEVIKDNTVTVKNSVTKEMLNALDANGASNYPTLTVYAYAIQQAGFDTAINAWTEVIVATAPSSTPEP